MSITDKLQNTLAVITGTTLNRYRPDILSCTAPLDAEDFSGCEAVFGEERTGYSGTG